MKLTKTEYNTLHVWVGRHFVKLGVCEFCKQKGKTDWSNKSGNYTKNRTDWQELCRLCHTKYDINVLNKKVGMPKGTKRKDSFYPIPLGFQSSDLLI